MKTTSELIDISMHILSYLSDLKFDTSSVQAIVKQSQYKDQYLKVSIKRMQETQFFKDELKESTELNSFLYAQNQELEAKLAQESQLKDGKFLLPLHLENQVISEYTLD
jgi:cell shape-determining protein MreC